MTVPLIARIGALVLASTAFYTYVGQMVPQKMVLPPEETVLGTELSTDDMVKVGRQIVEGKGLCVTCIPSARAGRSGFPTSPGLARGRRPGLRG